MFGKRNNSYIAFILAAIIILSLITVYASSASLETKLSARSAALYQPDTGSFLFSKNADQRMKMASTTKIMTALLAIENSDDLSELIEIPKEACGVEGSSAYLKCGDILSVEELLYALLLQSANDAACALAFHISGGVDEFADLMNERASQMGLENTHFTNPHGLDDDGHYTTARELAKIAGEAMNNSVFREIASTYKKTLECGERRRTYINHNKLLRSYDGAIGVKTGFTDESGRCLVGAAERDGLILISVTLDAPSDWADHKALLDLGFSMMEMVRLSSVYEYSFDIPTTSLKSIRVTNTDELGIILPRGEHEIKRYINLPMFISQNIEIGDKIGYIDFFVDGEFAGRASLIATEEHRIKEKNFFEKIKERLFG